MSEAEKKNPTIRELATERVKKTFVRSVPSLLLGFLLIGASFAIGIFFPPALLLAVPFVVVPSFCALHRACDLIAMDKDKEEEGNLFWRGFLSYFTSYFGSYHLLRILGLSLAIMMGVSLLVSTADYFIEMAVNPAFREGVNALEVTSGDSNFLVELFEGENSPFRVRGIIVTSVQGASFSISFLLLFARNVFLPYVKSATNAPQRMVLTMFRGGYRKVRSEFRHDYWGSTWHLFAFFLLGFGLGYLAFYFIFSNALVLGEQVLSASRWVIGGVGIGLLILIPFFPYYFSVVALTFHKHQQAFSDYTFELAEEALNQLIEQQEIDQNQVEEISRQISEAKEEIERLREERKEENPSDQGNDKQDGNEN